MQNKCWGVDPDSYRDGRCKINAGVAKLVDALDLGSSASRHGGSSPSARTNKKPTSVGFFVLQEGREGPCEAKSRVLHEFVAEQIKILTLQNQFNSKYFPILFVYSKINRNIAI
jgi:hypothetical protein